MKILLKCFVVLIIFETAVKRKLEILQKVSSLDSFFFFFNAV